MERSRDEGRGSPGERSREKREMMREKSRRITIYPPSTLFLNELTNERTRHLVQRRERLLPCRTRILSRSKGRGREGRGGVAEQQDDARPRQPRARAAPPPLRLAAAWRSRWWQETACAARFAIRDGVCDTSAARVTRLELLLYSGFRFLCGDAERREIRVNVAVLLTFHSRAQE